jgi:hypothetical protein
MDGRLCEVILAAKRNPKAHACRDEFQLPSCQFHKTVNFIISTVL